MDTTAPTTARNLEAGLKSPPPRDLLKQPRPLSPSPELPLHKYDLLSPNSTLTTAYSPLPTTTMLPRLLSPSALLALCVFTHLTSAVAMWNWLFLVFPNTETHVRGANPYHFKGTISPQALATIPRVAANLNSIISNTSAGMAGFQVTMVTFNTPITYAAHECNDGPGICYFLELADLGEYVRLASEATGEKFDGVVGINQAANDADGRWLGGNIRAACGYSEGQVGKAFSDTGFGHCWIPMAGGDSGFKRYDELFIHEMGHAIDMYYQRHGPESCKSRIPPEGHHILDQVDKQQNTFPRWNNEPSGFENYKWWEEYFTGNRPDPRIPAGSGISEACWAFGSPTRKYDHQPVRGPVRRWPGPTPAGPPTADGSGRLNEDIVDTEESTLGATGNSKEGWCGFEDITDIQQFR